MDMATAMRKHLPNRAEFKHGSVSGRTVAAPTTWETGRMPQDESARFAALSGPVYVVYSYATPIAWHDGTEWYVTDTRYSVTTSRHRGYVHSAIA